MASHGSGSVGLGLNPNRAFRTVIGQLLDTIRRCLFLAETLLRHGRNSQNHDLCR